MKNLKEKTTKGIACGALDVMYTLSASILLFSTHALPLSDVLKECLQYIRKKQ
jgi:hypothetical protein